MKLLLIVTILTACGTQSEQKQPAAQTESIPQETYVGAQLVETVQAMPECDLSRQKALIYVEETQSFFYCSSDSFAWTPIDLKGAKGDQGVAGVAGANGRDGVDGKDGQNGINGVDGVDGKDGVNGVDGLAGQNGQDGVDGKDGIDGDDGIDGANIIIASVQASQNVQIRAQYYAGFTTNNGAGGTVPVAAVTSISTKTFTLSSDDFSAAITNGLSCELTTISENIFNCSFLNSKLNCSATTHATSPDFCTAGSKCNMCKTLNSIGALGVSWNQVPW